MPDPLAIVRLAALLAFIGLVAVGLWLLDVAWWVVPPVMAVALLIAWTIEWLAWRGAVATTVARQTTVPASPLPSPPPEAPAPAPVEAIVPPPPEPEPAAEPEPRAEPKPEAVEAGETPPEPLPPEPERPPEPGRPPAPEPPAPEPHPPPQPEPSPQPQRPPEPVAAAPVEESRRERRRPRMRLRPVAPRPPEPPPAPAPEPPPASVPEAPVVPLRPRAEPRSWNLWDLERLARDETRDHPEHRDEWAYLFLHLRQFADADGALPTEFDLLVRESFGGLLERS